MPKIMKQKRISSYEYIVSDIARKAWLKKRWASMMKKLRELSILCNLRVCIVIYIPNQQGPLFWPSRTEVVRIMQHFIRAPEMEKSLKRMNQENYIMEKIEKLHEQLNQLQKRNQELEARHIMRQLFMRGYAALNEFSPIQLNNFEEYAVKKLPSIHKSMMMRRRRMITAY